MNRNDLTEFWYYNYYAEFEASGDIVVQYQQQRACFRELLGQLSQKDIEENIKENISIYLQTPEKSDIIYNHACILDRKEIKTAIEGIRYYIPFEYKIENTKFGYKVDFSITARPIPIHIFLIYIRCLFEHPYVYFVKDAVCLWKRKHLGYKYFLKCYSIVHSCGSDYIYNHSFIYKNSVICIRNKDKFNKTINDLKQRPQYVSWDVLELMSKEIKDMYSFPPNQRYNSFFNKQKIEERMEKYNYFYNKAK